MHILFVGYGKTSQAVAKQLLRLGHHVSTISRSPKPPDGAFHLVQDIHQMDLTALPAIDVVYVLLSPGSSDVQAYQHSFVDSVQPMLKALSTHPVRRVFLVSSTRVYGQRQGEVIDDDSLAVPSDQQGELLLQMERLWQAAYADKLTIIRPTGIYGRSITRMLKLAHNTQQYDHLHWSNRIHYLDLVEFLVHMLHVEHLHASSKCGSNLQPSYIVTDNCPIALHEILLWLQRQHAIQPLQFNAERQSGKRIYATRMLETGFELKYQDCYAVYEALFDRVDQVDNLIE